jgi:hypothetical protein
MPRAGLAYYTPGTKGAGQVVPTPDLSPLFAQLGKNAATARIAKDKAIEDKNKWANDLLAGMKEGGWQADQTYLNGKRKEFTDSFVEMMHKYEGREIPIEERTEKTLMANKLNTEIDNSTKFIAQSDAFQKFIANIDDEETKFAMMDEYDKVAKTPLSERTTDIMDLISRKTYNFTKAQGEVAKLSDQAANVMANSSGINTSSDGKYTNENSYRYVMLPTVQRNMKDRLVNDIRYKENMNKNYEQWRNDGRKDYKVRYTEYQAITDPATGKVLNPDKITGVVKEAEVNNIWDYMNYVAAPNMVYLRETDKVRAMGGGGGTSVTITGGAAGGPPQDYQVNYGGTAGGNKTMTAIEQGAINITGSGTSGGVVLKSFSIPLNRAVSTSTGQYMNNAAPKIKPYTWLVTEVYDGPSKEINGVKLLTNSAIPKELQNIPNLPKHTGLIVRYKSYEDQTWTDPTDPSVKKTIEVEKEDLSTEVEYMEDYFKSIGATQQWNEMMATRNKYRTAPTSRTSSSSGGGGSKAPRP